MGNFAFNRPADNVAPNATPSVSSPDAAYPATYATDLSDVNLGRPSKSTLVTDDWLFDFGSAQRVDLVVLWHNFDAALACSWQMNATNSWGTPTLSTALTIPAKRADGYTVKVFKDLTGVSGYSAGGFRYGRLHVSGTNSVPLGIKIWLGSSIRTLERNISWGLKPPRTHSQILHRTDGNAIWTYDLQAAPRSLGVNCGDANANDLAALTSLTDAAGGGKPIVVIPDPTVNDPWLCRYVGPQITKVASGPVDVVFDPTLQFLDWSPVSLAFEEVTAGGPEWI